MKSIFLCLLLSGVLGSALAQDFSALQSITFQTKEDYGTQETTALECANFLLASKFDHLESDVNCNYALQFVMKWMEGTPDYTFSIDEQIMKAIKSNSYLLGIYLSAMTKYVLENKANATNEKEVQYNSFVLFLDYCENTANQVKANKEIKNLSKAKNEGRLKEYLAN